MFELRPQNSPAQGSRLLPGPSKRSSLTALGCPQKGQPLKLELHESKAFGVPLKKSHHPALEGSICVHAFCLLARPVGRVFRFLGSRGCHCLAQRSREDEAFKKLVVDSRERLRRGRHRFPRPFLGVATDRNNQRGRFPPTKTQPDRDVSVFAFISLARK